MTLHAKRLSTYLNDHLAAATGGVELAKRALGSNEGTSYGDFLAEVRETLEADKAALLEAMERLDVDKSPVKESLGWVAEKLGRLKLNGQLIGYSPLSRFIEVEALSLGLEGKRLMWLALLDTESERFGADRLRELVARAERQREGLEEQRRRAAREATGGPRSTRTSAGTPDAGHRPA